LLKRDCGALRRGDIVRMRCMVAGIDSLFVCVYVVVFDLVVVSAVIDNPRKLVLQLLEIATLHHR
jgi:hypothetical protein